MLSRPHLAGGDDAVAPSRRAVMLLAAAADVPPDQVRSAVARHAHVEAGHLIEALPGAVVRATVNVSPEVNPMAGTSSMMGASDYVAAVTVDLADETADEVLLGGLERFADRQGAPNPSALDLGRSSIVVGWFHQLRDRPAPSGTQPLTVLVAVQPTPGLAMQEFRDRWLTLGRVNARNHPTCIGYGQLHADVDLTARAMERSGLAFGPFAGVAVEVFPGVEDLHAGHRYAMAASSLEGSPVEGENLIALLGQVLDFTSSGKLLAVDDPPPGEAALA